MTDEDQRLPPGDTAEQQSQPSRDVKLPTILVFVVFYAILGGLCLMGLLFALLRAQS